MQERLKGILIVLDGVDGCGKTVHSKALREGLKARGFDAVYTAEPSSSIVGKFIRTILSTEKVPPNVEALLFAADRYEHLKREILPSLVTGKVVICDRYLYSSLAYQGAQGVDTNWIRAINNFSVKPDVAIYLDVPADVGLSRIKRKRTVLENLDLQKKVREKYLQLVQDGELVLVNSNRAPEEVKADVLEFAVRALEKRS
jgi:dTMP kinase